MGRIIEKSLRLLLLLGFPITLWGQQETTFRIENLTRPPGPLPIRENMPERLILSEIDMTLQEVERQQPDFPFGIIAHDGFSVPLVDFGHHAFFNGMYQAYAEHRPYVLSPDMIWLLISQGFARHVHANPEILRDSFVRHEGRKPLIVQSKTIGIDNPDGWEKIFPQFTKQIAANAGEEIVRLLSADFSTTTPAEKIASEITIMETMKPYFEYIVMRVICGIPEITLLGTPEDWRKVQDKTRELGRYGLEWWTGELAPILEQFVEASEGNVDKAFWRNMFKYHSLKEYGAPRIIDGWIVRFFPYDKNGRRNDLKQLTGTANLPDEIVKTDVNFIDEETGETTPLELWAGFIGLEQDDQSFALTPRIGWIVRKKDVNQTGLKQKLGINGHDRMGNIAFRDEIVLKASFDNGDQIRLRDREIPRDIFELKGIRRLEISFTGRIAIPDQMATLDIKELFLTGETDEAETERIRGMFPKTELRINGAAINKP